MGCGRQLCPCALLSLQQRVCQPQCCTEHEFIASVVPDAELNEPANCVTLTTLAAQYQHGCLLLFSPCHFPISHPYCRPQSQNALVEWRMCNVRTAQGNTKLTQFANKYIGVNSTVVKPTQTVQVSCCVCMPASPVQLFISQSGLVQSTEAERCERIAAPEIDGSRTACKPTKKQRLKRKIRVYKKQSLL